MDAFTIKLGKREVRLRLTNGGLADMQMLPNGQPAINDLFEDGKAYGALLVLVWGCLPSSMRDSIKPRDLAKFIEPNSDSMQGPMKAFFSAHDEAYPQEDDEDESEGSVKNDKPAKERKSASKAG